MHLNQRSKLAVLSCAALVLSGCAALGGKQADDDPADEPNRDKTKKGAIGGAIGGAIIGAVVGEGEADEILLGAAIGAGVGAGVGHYMDKQEQQLQEIPGTTVERVSDDTLLLHMDDELLFAKDSTQLSSRSQASLDEMARVIMDYPKTAVIVQGHTDSMGTEADNRKLSEHRAEAVKNYLIGRGIDGSRITAVGYGAQYADDYAGNNRRVDILLKAKA